MGRSSSTHPLEGLHLTSQANENPIMLRFVALFALVAVALAEPEADPQVFTYNHVAGVPVVGAYSTHVVKPVVGATHVVKPVVPVVKYHVPLVKAAVPVVKYVDPHHTGVAQTGVYPYSSVHPYTYGYGYPYTTAVSGYTYPVVHPSVVKHPVVHHSVMKREADSESQFYYSHYNTPYAYNYGYGYPYTYNNVYNTYGVYGR